MFFRKDTRLRAFRFILLLEPICEAQKLVYFVVIYLSAGIAQLVEHDLAKVGVASSNLVSRSKI